MTANETEALDLDHLLPALAAGDVDAFARWVRRAEPAIRSGLRSFAAWVDVEGVVQETLLRIWQVGPRFVPDGRANGLLRLAMRTARNQAISQLRRRHIEPMEIDALDREALEQHLSVPAQELAADPALRRRIEDCLRGLPRQPGRALRARLVDDGGQDDATLASGIGMRPNTFLQNITRARRLLIECLRRHGIDLETELT